MKVVKSRKVQNRLQKKKGVTPNGTPRVLLEVRFKEHLLKSDLSMRLLSCVALKEEEEGDWDT